MAQLHAIDFTAGPDGGNVTKANTPAINGTQTGTNPTFSADIPAGQAEAYSARVNLAVGSTSFNNATFTSQSAGVWIGGYLQLTALPVDVTYWLLWYNTAGTKVGDARINTDGSLAVRDNNTAVATSVALALNTWHRFAVYCDPGSATGHRLKLYLGNNRHGSTADFDTAGAATAAGLTEVSGFRFGHFIAATADARYRISRLRVDTVEPAPIAAAATRFRYYVDGATLKLSDRKFVNGAALV